MAINRSDETSRDEALENARKETQPLIDSLLEALSGHDINLALGCLVSCIVVGARQKFERGDYDESIDDLKRASSFLKMIAERFSDEIDSKGEPIQ